MLKTLTTDPNVWNRVETEISEENTKRSPPIRGTVVVTVRKDHDEEITQLDEVEHIKIEEAIRLGKLRLHELEKDRVRLRKKIILMDADIKTLENEIKQACLVDKPRMTRQYIDDHTTTLEECCREFMILLPWLRPHLTKCSN